MEENKNGIIPAGLDATDMRLRMETKKLINQDIGATYIGTGQQFYYSDNNKYYVQTDKTTPRDISHTIKQQQCLCATWSSGHETMPNISWSENIPVVILDSISNRSVRQGPQILQDLNSWCQFLGISDITPSFGNILIKLNSSSTTNLQYTSPLTLKDSRGSQIRFVYMYIGNFVADHSYSANSFNADNLLLCRYVYDRDDNDSLRINIYVENNLTQGLSFYGG